MAIRMDQTGRLFTLDTDHTTYQMKADQYGFLLHLYYGRRTPGDMTYLLTQGDRGFSPNPYDARADRTYSLDFLPQEFPLLGNGDYRSPALIVEDGEGTLDCDLRYDSCRVEEGKFSIPRLPAVYADAGNRETGEGAQTLIITLKDRRLGLKVDLYYGVLPRIDLITRAVRIEAEKEKVVLRRAQSACLDFTHGSYDVLTFYGRHAMERTLQRSPVGHGTFSIGSTRGTSSHQYNPLLILADPSATEDAGSCYGMSFVYSGGFSGEVSKDQFGDVRMQMGLSDQVFSYPLERGEVFWTPEVAMTFSDRGFTRLSQTFHKCCQKHLIRGKYRDERRPVLINSWEACYFDFDGEKILDLARSAKDLGFEMLVMDDGWFGQRDDDHSGLGDWSVNEKKLGMPLQDLVSRVNEIGLKFGIWFEPEMISQNSDLFRAHPDYAMTIPGRDPVLGRDQLLLDFSRPDVVDEIYRQMKAVLDSTNIEYVKWDFNRSIFNVYSHSGRGQGTVLYDFVLGLYDLLDRLNREYPDLLIEGCSGGGGRFDMGMLYYTPQIWCSDNSDAIDRTSIQYGTSFAYPLATMGAHVSVSPNEQNGRVTPLKTRGIVAMHGTFGYELDPTKMPEEEKEEVRRQIETYKTYADLIREGDYYRLSNPLEKQAAAWETVSSDKGEALVSAVLLDVHGNNPPTYVTPKGLDPDALYRDTESGRVYPGAALMQEGLPLPAEMGQYHAYLYHLVRI